MDAQGLKSCPFCGSSAGALRKPIAKGSNIRGWYVGCAAPNNQACLGQFLWGVPFPTRKAAAEAWNTRSRDDERRG